MKKIIYGACALLIAVFMSGCMQDKITVSDVMSKPIKNVTTTVQPAISTVVPVYENILLNNEAIKYYGRTFVSPNEAWIDWSASGLEFCVIGGSVRVRFDAIDAGSHQRVYMAVYVNGERTQKFNLNSGNDYYTLAENLPKNEVSTILVTRLTEASMGKATITALELTGKLEKNIKEKTRKIEWIGDSITCGYGILGGSHLEPFKAITQDVTYTYAQLCTDALDAQMSIIAASGYGVIASTTGDPKSLIPRIYPYFNAISRDDASGRRQDFDSYRPDLVVVNLGTNDFSGTGGNKTGAKMLKKGITKFLNSLRSAHPDATICWIYGMMTSGFSSEIKEAVEKFGKADSKVFYIAVPEQNAKKNRYASNYHPNIRSHKDFAEYLTPRLRKLMNY